MQFIVSKRCSGGKRQRGVTRRGTGYWQQEVFRRVKCSRKDAAGLGGRNGCGRRMKGGGQRELHGYVILSARGVQYGKRQQERCVRHMEGDRQRDAGGRGVQQRGGRWHPIVNKKCS